MDFFKNKWAKLGGAVAVVLGTVALILGGADEKTVTELVGLTVVGIGSVYAVVKAIMDIIANKTKKVEEKVEEKK